MNRNARIPFVAASVGALVAVALLALAACRQRRTVGIVQNTSGISQGVDTVAGDFNNLFTSFSTPGTQGLIKSTSGAFVGVNACNEGTSTAWLAIYNSSAPDAGGSSAGSVSPLLTSLRLPAGTCGNVSGVVSASNGLVWYSSTAAGVVSTAGGQQNLAVDAWYR